MFVMSLLIDFQVKENSKAGTVIGKISVVDPDNKHKEVHGFKCSVESRDLDFKISPLVINSKNELSVDNPANLNYEYKPFHNIRVSSPSTTNSQETEKVVRKLVIKREESFVLFIFCFR